MTKEEDFIDAKLKNVKNEYSITRNINVTYSMPIKIVELVEKKAEEIGISKSEYIRSLILKDKVKT